MAKIVWTNEAERWLLKIHDHLQRPDGEVHILGVFHGAMELDRYLR